MTLTELKYIVAVARERHFGRAAEACFVSQPTLSVAIKKLEDELNVQIFERGTSEVSVTPIGEQIVTQAQRVLEQTLAIKEIAKQGKDPLVGPLRLGVIYTIGPYLLPTLVKQMIRAVPQMPLMLQENYTLKLIELLKQGEIDVAIMALPFPETGLMVRALYDEPFVVAMPSGHAWENRGKIDPDDLKQETMLLLGSGHCFRDHVLGVCPEADALLAERGRHSEDIRGLVAGNHPAHGGERCRHYGAAAYVGAGSEAARRRRRFGAAQLCAVRRAGAGSPRGARVAQELYAHARHRRHFRCHCRLRPAGRQEARHAGRGELTGTRFSTSRAHANGRGFSFSSSDIARHDLPAALVAAYQIDQFYRIRNENSF
ncbi:DNA-binding transcriptional LysR family regulator [Paraburkholderia sp. BL8N3]|nr:DNA-binding transcriptional LysR family regulator [Paraburkholderia sp. BL8N3]